LGWIIWRDAHELPEELVFSVNYLGGTMPVFQINFSRPAGQIVSQYYLFLRLGREGYRKIHQACYDTARYLADGILKLGRFELVFDGDAKHGIPAVTWKIKESENPGYTLFDIADRLHIRGWQVPAYTLPNNLSDVVVQRAIVRHGLSMDFASLLLDDLERAMAHFEKHPISAGMTESETSGFKHT
jgi:glutamate decarboxylase